MNSSDERKRACIDLLLPESGDAELDALITKARRRQAILAIACAMTPTVPKFTVQEAVDHALDVVEHLGGIV